jgi:hypothetical protein
VTTAPAMRSPPGLEERERALLEAGWVRRFVAPAERIFEHVALYNELGYEVHLEPASPEGLSIDCSGCAPALAQQRVIYTRRER